VPVPGPRVPCLELGRAGRGRIAGSGRSSCQGVWPAGPAAFPFRRRRCVALGAQLHGGRVWKGHRLSFLEGLGVLLCYTLLVQ
jgi:hypothetical protein